MLLRRTSPTQPLCSPTTSTYSGKLVATPVSDFSDIRLEPNVDHKHRSPSNAPVDPRPRTEPEGRGIWFDGPNVMLGIVPGEPGNHDRPLERQVPKDDLPIGALKLRIRNGEVGRCAEPTRLKAVSVKETSLRGCHREASGPIHMPAISELGQAEHNGAGDASNNERGDSLPASRQDSKDQQYGKEKAEAADPTVHARDRQQQCKRWDEEAPEVNQTKYRHGDEYDNRDLQWPKAKRERRDSSHEKRQRAEVLDFLGKLKNSKGVAFRIHSGHECKRVGRRQSHLQSSRCEQGHQLVSRLPMPSAPSTRWPCFRSTHGDAMVMQR